MCMSFDAWIVGFGLSRTFIDVGILGDPLAYVVLAIAAAVDLGLLFQFFRRQRRGELATVAVAAH
jgi:hypothetical protein